MYDERSAAVSLDNISYQSDFSSAMCLVLLLCCCYCFGCCLQWLTMNFAIFAVVYNGLQLAISAFAVVVAVV